MGSRLPLLWKILLSTSVSITLLFALAGWIILRHVSTTTTESIEEEVQTSLRAYESLWNSRVRMLASVSLVMSSMSDVRAAFSTGDQATIRDTAQELWSKVSAENAIFLVTDPQGRLIASLGGGPSQPRGRIDLVPQAARHFPRQVTGFMVDHGALYQVAVTPVYLQSATGPALWNVLVAGFRVDELAAQNLKQVTAGSDFLFRTPQQVMASTLSSQDSADILRGQGPAREYASRKAPLTDVDGQPIGELWILRSFQKSQERIATLRRDIFLLWLLAVCIGLALTYLLARRIVQPVRELARAADRVAQQDYTCRVEVSSQDELGTLAQAFNSMCDSIRVARDELIRHERIATISRLSSSLVHDLRNPLAAIYGAAEMLVDREMPESRVRRLAGSIYRASRHIQSMLQDLLDASQVKEEKKEVCKLADVAAAAGEALAATAESQGVQMVLQIPEDLELPLQRSRMERVFLNLLANSLDAMPSGGSVRVTARVDGDMIRVEAQDTGRGIAPEIFNNLFRPFVTAGKKTGLGLGLAISRQTLLDHGGDLRAENPPGGGARFVLELPLAPSAQAVESHVN